MEATPPGPARLWDRQPGAVRRRGMLPGCGSRSDGSIPQCFRSQWYPASGSASIWRSAHDPPSPGRSRLSGPVVIGIPMDRRFSPEVARHSSAGLIVANGVGVIDPDYSGPNRRGDDSGDERHGFRRERSAAGTVLRRVLSCRRRESYGRK